MSNKIENPPVFPQAKPSFVVSCDGTINQSESEIPYMGGMTLRDYFAAKAMHGLLANPNTKQDLIIAEAAFQIADTMLKARAK